MDIIPFNNDLGIGACKGWNGSQTMKREENIFDHPIN